MRPAIHYPASARTPEQRAVYATMRDGLLRDLGAPINRPLPPLTPAPAPRPFRCDCGRGFAERRGLMMHQKRCRQ